MRSDEPLKLLPLGRNNRNSSSGMTTFFLSDETAKAQINNALLSNYHTHQAYAIMLQPFIYQPNLWQRDTQSSFVFACARLYTDGVYNDARVVFPVFKSLNRHH